MDIPKEIKVASLLLESCGVTECEPKVLTQLVEFISREVSNVLADSLDLAEHVGRSSLELDDVRIALKNRRMSFNRLPSFEFLNDLASRKNSIPLIHSSSSNIPLPPDNHLQLGSTYRITSVRKPLESVPSKRKPEFL